MAAETVILLLAGTTIGHRHNGSWRVFETTEMLFSLMRKK